VNLSGAFLYRTSFFNANLSDANLSGAFLYRAALYENLSGAHLTDANLDGAHLTDTNLDGANLTDANLTDVNLSGADLSGASFSWADLSGSDLSGALNLSQQQVEVARGNEETKLPDHLKLPASWSQSSHEHQNGDE
jgi:uncharacterized protein YjbI with pentapeptide repeats